MAAPIGNQFWKARTTHGRKRLFESAETLWDACCEYFQWVEDNPLYESETVKFQGQATLIEIPKMRAMTLGGLCIFLDISRGTWNEWRNVDDFSEVLTRVEEIIRDQKFSGAAAELLNPNIIARDLGLADSSNIDHRSGDGSMSPKSITVTDPIEAAKQYQEIMGGNE